MNVRTLRKLDLILGPGPGRVSCWLVYKFISSAFSALETKYCDNDCVDEEDEARSSSGVLILALRYEISAALESDLKQNLSPAGFTLDESNTRHKSPPSWMRQTADGGRLPAQVTRDKIFFRICKMFFWIWPQVLDLQICLKFTK